MARVRIGEIKITSKSQKDDDKDLRAIIDLTNRQFIEWLKEETEVINDEVIFDFYASYSPTLYGRAFDLDDVVKFIINESEQRYDYDTGALGGHRLGSEDLFSLTFEHGYHGGAPSGPGHPSPGTPYWRTPPPNYNRWGKPATKTTPIAEELEAALSGIDTYGKWMELFESNIS